MDYKLDGLSTRTFEHLVQALAVSAISNELIPFGDGPDGGREATFDGPTMYGSEGAPWAGYGVIQAKFRQRPGSNDGQWAEKELAKELHSFKNRKRKRRVPAYYIFATNVVLSPAQDTGGKDRILSKLKKFAQENGLKGYDVWDYDKIRVLLDNNRPVRLAYSAWITPGDVLFELAEQLRRRRHDYYKIVINYLQKEVLADQFAKLEQAGHSADEAIPLSQVFVDLPVTTEPTQNLEQSSSTREDRYYFTKEVVKAAASRFTVPQLPSSTAMEDQDPALERAGRFVLIGGPGQGKTTLGQFLCQIFRTALLVDVNPSMIDPPVKQAMDGVVSQWQASLLPKPLARRLPFRIVLSEFAKRLANGEVSGILDDLAKTISKRAGVTVDSLDIRELLLAYPSLLVLDGLDEVPASTNRTQLLECVRDFRIDIITEQIDVLVVATSRPQGYNDDFSAKLYQHLYLMPLPAKVALGYARLLTQIRFGQDPSRSEKVIARLGRALKSPSTARLMQSPLQVTIMTLLVDRMGQPPQERWALFSEYYNLIYQREIEREIPAASVLRDYRNDIDTIHARVGLILQVESERSGGTDSRLTTTQFSDIVEGYLLEEGHEGEHLNSLRESIIEAAANRLVFLVGLESGQVGFEIRSLQEFMAAEGLMDEDTRTQARLRLIAPVSNWRNVFLFAAGKAFSQRKHLRDTIGQICHELNDDPGDEINVVIKAGSRLALDLLEDGPAARQPAMSRSLTRLAFQLLDTGDSEALSRLVSIYQERLAPIFVEELGWRLARPTPAAKLAAVLTARIADLIGTDFNGLVEKARPHLAVPDEETLRLLTLIGDGRAGIVRDGILSMIGPLRPSGVIRTLDERYIFGRVFWSPSEVMPAFLATLHRYSVIQRDLRELSVRIRMEDGSQVGQLKFISVEQPDETRHGLDFPSGNPNWEYLKAVANFIKSPSPQTLVRALQNARSVDDEALLSYMSIAPWPISTALNLASNEGWEKVLDEVGRGHFGNFDSWREREDSLLNGMPLDGIIDNLDLVSVGRVSLEHEPSRISQIVRFAEQHKDLMRCSSFAFALCSAVGVDWSEQVPSEFTYVADVAFRICMESQLKLVGLQLLERVAPSNPTDEEWDHLFRDLTSVSDAYITSGAAGPLMQILTACWNRRPSLELLVGFSLCAPWPQFNPGEFPQPDVSDVKLAADCIKAAVVVVDARRNGDVGRVSSLLRFIEGSDYMWEFRLFAALRAKISDTCELEKQMLNLYQLSTTSNLKLSEGARRELVRTSAMRKSGLISEATWRGLGFPAELRWAIIENDGS